MSWVIGDTYRQQFGTVNDGAPTNADSAPTGVLRVNGSATAATVTVTNLATGSYEASVSLAGRSNGDVCEVVITAAIGGTSYPMGLGAFRVDASVDSRLAPTTAGRTLTVESSGAARAVDSASAAALATYAQINDGVMVSLGALATTLDDVHDHSDQITNSQLPEVLTNIAGLPASLASTANLTILAAATGSTLDVYGKDSYANADGRGITITKASTETHWPTTLSTVHFYCWPHPNTLEEDSDAASLSDIACTVTTATGDSRAFRLDLTSAQLSTLTEGRYLFAFVANKATNKATLRSGAMNVRAAPPALA